MKIYWIKTHASRRVLALVKHLGLDADCVEVDMPAGGLRTPSYLALNPNSKAPALVDGDLTLWESSAIMAYLCVKTDSDLWPVQRPAEQIEILRWLSWNDCHWSPAVGTFYFELVIKPALRLGEPDQSKVAAMLPALRKFATVLDEHLERRDFVACDRLTIADFVLASMACEWRDAQMPFQDYPHIARWLDGLMAIHGWDDPWPAKALVQKDSAMANA